jgi:APA family basic amino acid/polyamine antiporter
MDRLKRELGTFGAVLLGLGSIVGTGVFVSIGISAGVAGPAVSLAIVIAALVATCNGLSSAQLAANHPVSGGTYEYGYRFLAPAAGFVAGWMFLIAKSASAATAALGFAGYLFGAIGVTDGPYVLLAVAAVVVLGVLVLAGIRRSIVANGVIVSITILSLVIFVIAVAGPATKNARETLVPFFAPLEGRGAIGSLLQASALMFVAYTGYGRIATLGEEVREPKKTIPRAVVVTLVVTMLLYVSVSLVATGAVGSARLSETPAPLEVAAFAVGADIVARVLSVGAIAAMLGVLLNLLLGLSRVLLAMGRRKDMPSVLGRLNKRGDTPSSAVVVMTLVVVGLTLIGDVETTWSFSAFTVLTYYGLTNLSALFIPDEGRLFPRWISALGLVGCLSLAVFVPPRILLLGAVLIVAGLVWHAVATRVGNDM